MSADALVKEIRISETLLKGKKTLTESTTKCLDELNKIWMPFAKKEEKYIEIADCVELGSPWVLRLTPPITDFYEVYEVVGKPGAYGIVRRGINKKTQKKVAIKHINKMRYKNHKSQKMYFSDLRNEAYLMLQAADHPHVVSVHHVFEDVNTLFFVISYCEGGELFNLLAEKKQLDEVTASYLFRQMVTAIYYLHSLGIAHCDLKPENFVFADSKREELILIDFGMAKIIEFRRYFKMVSGSPFYVAPEVLKNHYNEACDIWSLGIVLFVIVFGYCPFYCSGPLVHKKVYSKILKGFTPKIKFGYGAWFPKSQPVSAQCRDLIGRMLRMNYADRITAEEILEHPWLKCVENDEIGMEKLTKITNPNIINSLKGYNPTRVVLQDQVLSLLKQCKYLNTNQINSLKDFLTAADLNKDNEITPDELLKALKEMDGDVTSDDIDSIFTAIDVNKDGVLSFDEIISARINRKLQSKECRLKKVFSSFDYNDDGKITKKELEASWQSVMIHSDQQTDVDFQTIIKEVDKNDDGQIDYEEFLAVFGKSKSFKDLKEKEAEEQDEQK